MDVSCARCNTEYDFDDALISERGTTVRCTECGYEFKIFPATAGQLPEVWEVVAASNPTLARRRYESLGELQRAITRGEVAAEDLLARGGEKPRPLASIVELQPLLRQPIVPPAAAGAGPKDLAEDPAPPTAEVVEIDNTDIRSAPDNTLALDDVGSVDAAIDALGAVAPLEKEAVPVSRDVRSSPAPSGRAAAREERTAGGRSGTALGLPSLADVEQARKKTTSSSVGAVGDGVAGTAEPEPLALESTSTPSLPLAGPVRPRIQSALTARPSEGEAEDAPTSSQKSAKLASPLSARSQLPSLSSTLTSKQGAASLRPVLGPGLAGGKEPALDQSPPSSLPPPLPADAHFAWPAAEPPRGEASVGGPSSGPLSFRREPIAPSAPRASGVPHVPNPSPPRPRNPLLGLAPGDYADSVTPTPHGLRAYQGSETAPISAVASAPQSRGARSGLIVGAVLMGAAAFVGLSSRERISGWVDQSKPAPPAASIAAEVPGELEQKLIAAELDWWRLRLLPEDEPRRNEAKGALPERLSYLESAWAERGDRRSGWARVDTLRMQARLGPARQAVASLKGPKDLYSLAMLDLSDEAAEPPWPVIVHQLEEAKNTADSRGLAAAALVYSLAASGKIEEARLHLEQLRSRDEGNALLLVADLGQFLERRAALVSSEGGAAADIEVPPVELEAASDESVSGPEKLPPLPKPAPVSPEVRALVDQADNLWASGDLRGASELYRKVLEKVDTKHFLGQRASARIAHAQRERAQAKE